MMTRKSSNSNSTTVTVTPCCSKVGIKRGPWTAEEDEVLAAFVRKEGEGRWRTLPKRAGLARCGKSCRLRWMNYLRPSVKRGHIAADEEDLILRLHRLLGNRWSLIAGRIPGRTDNEIKNYWNTHLSKKLISQGIDPRTHKPFKPNSDDKNNNINSSSSCKTDDEDRRRPCNPNYNGNKKMKIQVQQSTHDDRGKSIIIQENIASTTTSENNNNIIVDHRINHFENEINTTHQLLINDDQEADDLSYCTDDVFSSFLNSLINEDAFAPIIDPFLSVNTESNGWESTIVSSSSSSSCVPINQINNTQG